MEQQKPKKNKYVTPVYPARWCWLLTPDTRWSELGTYGCDLVMSGEHVRELCQTVFDDVKKQADDIRRADATTKDWKLVWPVKDDPEKPELKLVSFQQKVVANYNFSVDVFDARNNPIDPRSGLRIGNGTKVRLSYYARVVADNLNSCLRVKFHPRAAQIVELVPWKADYGFDATDGYTFENGRVNGKQSTGSDFTSEDREFVGSTAKTFDADVIPDSGGPDTIPF